MFNKTTFKLAATAALAAALAICSPAAESHLMRHADVHGDRVVFTYEGDLWLAQTSGGNAWRITSDPGEERFAKFSPDGSRLAFTASYDGGVDVYVMDAAGGVPTRLTYHPAPDLVLGWYPDGASILFRSRREYPFRGEQVYKVSVNGGTEEKLPVDRAGLTALSPDGARIAYNRISGESATWKRHQGGDAQELWMGSLKDGDFKKIAEWAGMDNFPMWEGDYIYFTSDREAGTLNIFKYDVKSGAVKAVTRYTDYDVKYPSSGPGAIVYQYGETLHLLDLKTEQSRKLDIGIPSDRVRVREDYISSTTNTGAFSLSPDGKRLLLESRGEILSVPEKDKGEAYNLTRSSGSREKNGAWSPDGKKVVFISDKSGEEELYLAEPDGQGEWKRLTTDGKGFRMQPVWSPDSKYILFSDKYMKLNLLDVTTGSIKQIDRGDYDDGWERWGIQDYVWSPCSRWIAYTKKMENTNEIILLYSMDTGKTVALTDDMTQSWSPSFDPKGRYLYFLSNRSYKPVMGTIDQEHIFLNMAKPYVLVLKKGDPSPFAPEGDAVKVDEEKPKEEAKEKGKDKEKSDKEKKPETKPTVIDLGDFEMRTVPAEGVEPGNYFRLSATDKGFLYLSKTQEEFLKYQAVTDLTPGSLDLFSYDLKDKKAAEVLKGIQNYHISADGKKVVYKAGGKFGAVDCGAKSNVGDGSFELGDVKIKIDRLAEFAQIFDEAWRIERDWFYDAGMHGVDWKATGEKYRKFVAECGNRSDLNYLIGEMIAELNAGHTYVWGGDLESGGKRRPVGLLGCEFEPSTSGGPKIRRIVRGNPWDREFRSPFTEPGCPVREGDYIVAIDGEKLTPRDNVYKFLENKADRDVTITYSSKPTGEGAKTWRARTLRSEQDLRYREWVDDNVQKVSRLTNGEIGYIHIPEMQEEGLKEFARTYFPQCSKRALVIDARYNAGGFTGDMMLARLLRQVWAVTQPREGKPSANPEASFFGPMALLINEDTGSNGEFFAEAIKIKKVAKVFGMRTWGGSVGIEAHQDLVDGGTVTPPQFGLYGLDGKWMIEGHGVDPDVEVQNMPGDVLKGKDAQLDAALEYLKGEMKKYPAQLPGPPPYPKKQKPYGSDLNLR